MIVTDELYVLPDGENYILYAPLLRTLLTVNRDVVDLLAHLRSGKRLDLDSQSQAVLQQLRDTGIIESTAAQPAEQAYSDDFRPARVTFLPTLSCNLRCIYCYADSGKLTVELPLPIAEAAIDFVVANAVAGNVPNIQVGFLGGGEPFLAWHFMRAAVSYAEARGRASGKQVFVTGVTNGVLSRDQVAWVADHFQYLNISLDGPELIQDAHRPTVRQAGSYKLVCRTVTSLRERGFKFAVRSTISSLSVDHMAQILRHFAEDLGVRRIHFEPLFACGRCQTSPDLAPEPERFIENFKACLPVAQECGVELFCSLVRLDTLASTFCGAMLDNFYITPHGFVTACTEVSSPDEPMAKEFFIGKYDVKVGAFVFWNDQRRRLASRTVMNLNSCQGCIAKWHCAGGCAVKAGHTSSVYDAGPLSSCTIARSLTEFYVRTIAARSGINPPRVSASVASP